MTAAGECICEVAWHIVTVPGWLNADLTAKLQMETRVSSCGIATLLLEKHPGQAKDMDTHGKLGPLSRAIGKAGEPCLARAEGTA